MSYINKSSQNNHQYKSIIENAWEKNNKIDEDLKSIIDEVLLLINQGVLTVVEKNSEDDWCVVQWVKKAVLLYFKANTSNMNYKNDDFPLSFDKVPLKFTNWTKENFEKAKIRAVPGSIVRNGTFIGENVVLMPSFVNIGAFVGSGSMIDTWATVGSCAYVGKNCHISGGVGIGGCLEPIQGSPVIVEDNCFIGGRCQLAEGVIIGHGSVLATGVNLSSSTPIIDKTTGEKSFGYIPSYSVVIPGSLSKKTLQQNMEISYNCAIIVKKVDARTRAKTSINDILRS